MQWVEEVSILFVEWMSKVQKIFSLDSEDLNAKRLFLIVCNELLKTYSRNSGSLSTWNLTMTTTFYILYRAI